MAKELLKKSKVNSKELEVLLKARERGEVEFLLIDVREPFEYKRGHIVGVDKLYPTSLFHEWADEFMQKFANMDIILTCRTANRSGTLQRHLKSMGHKGNLIDHSGGIVMWHGDIKRGD